MTQRTLKRIFIDKIYCRGTYKYELVRRWGFDKTKFAKYYIIKTRWDIEIKRYNFNAVCKLKRVKNKVITKKINTIKKINYEKLKKFRRDLAQLV